MKKNNTAEKTILKAEKVSQALKEGTEKTLRSILNEAVSNAIKDDDSELVDGLVFPKPSDTSMLGVNRVVNAKIGLIQFHLSAPKTDIDNKVILNDYTQMDRLLREEKKYILDVD